MSVNLLFNLTLNTGIIMKYNLSVVECPSDPILVVVLVIAWIWLVAQYPSQECLHLCFKGNSKN